MSREPLAFDSSGELIEPSLRGQPDPDPLDVVDWEAQHELAYRLDATLAEAAAAGITLDARGRRDLARLLPDAGRPGLLGLLLVAIVTFVFGMLVGSSIAHAAPRPAPEHVVPAIAPGRTGAPIVVTDSDVPAVGTGAPTPPAARAPSRPPATPRPAQVGVSHSRTGTASWYADSRKSGLYAAAGPSLRVGNWRGRTVTVSAGGHSFRVVLSDFCGCPARLIDLSPSAFSRLAPLSRGLVQVTVRW